ncbi:MAG: DUF3881 family protein [Lachnospiraceae bacterium]|nr:DUF3881 family protein [Lachnospiraceae bacterium]
MHRYLRSVGFAGLTDHKEINKLLKDVVLNADERSYTTNEEDVLLGEFCRNFADGIGISVCGEFDEEDKFTLNYYFPYLKGTGVSSLEDVTVERHAAKESYAGVCDDLKVGISLIFYLKNMIPYIRAKVMNRLPVKGTTLTLSALCVQGTVILPVEKDEDAKNKAKAESDHRTSLLQAARQGDEDAIETLTIEDMDLYTSISKRVFREDILSIVDTYFMPYGVECDQYSVLGEILGVRKVKNSITGEEIYVLTLCCNELTFDVCINIIDLVGEPQVGRRFKGAVWLMGEINYPEEI